MKTPRPLALIIMGVSGSGKSTIGHLLSRATGITFIDADAYHPEANLRKMKHGVPLNDEDRKPWLERLHELIETHIDKEESCILACSALKDNYRRILDKGIEHHVKFIHLDGDISTIRERIHSRSGHFMPPDLLTSQFLTLEKPVEALVYSIESDPEDICNSILEDLTVKAEFGVIGMGVMGCSISRNLATKHIRLALYNREAEGEEALAEKRIKTYPELKEAKGFNDLQEFTSSLSKPRKILLMVPSGVAVNQVVGQLKALLDPGDVIIDGGNSHYKDTQRLSRELQEAGIWFLGCGISGGEKGALTGPSLMPGGHPEGYLIASPYLWLLAAKDKNGAPCCSYLGKDGSGHFVKMVHNGIEYAEMQLLAELYHLMKRGEYSSEKMHEVFSAFNGGPLESYLLSITCDILNYYENGELLLDAILDKAGNKGTGSWASVAGAKTGTPVSMITASLFARYVSFFKEKRVRLNQSFTPPQEPISLEPEILKQAYTLARFMNHVQGFELLQAGISEESYSYALHEVARIWTQGCIIRSVLMETLSATLKDQPEIMLQEETIETAASCRSALQTVIIAAIKGNVATPALSAALNYLNGITEANSPANLIQAQRDYFGAHKYQKREDPSSDFYHTQWE
ncbi:NADP-dependent phosphogluconate dehydrogenase [Robertkochia flava]|uniref:NADP-dependent phosphogluconate dehydrogenase n=1 Tax=Robertkochia flava TaxID=3447986 RepID=UPI001CCC1310|nr:NADP-dependent phosphogluconate dehydrogenase [Robertkochia marina]